MKEVFLKLNKKKPEIQETVAQRKEKILKNVIKHYLNYGEPVASKFLVMRCNFNVSSATIRNDFRELTEEGYLYKCHLSSGRLPTNKALKYFINEILKNREILEYWTNLWEEQLQNLKAEAISDFLDEIADKSHSLVFYYDPQNDILEKHGLKYIFSRLVNDYKKEKLIIEVAEAIDHLDKRLENLRIEKEPLILIGKDNPFIPNDDFSALITKSIKNQNIYGLLGFKSMPYDKHLGLLNALSELI
ncbi:MAG: DeoR family transcriptional regulator [Minisyncoccia bacterium]|jgi:transcriptional regulator of heat shock response